VYARRYGEDLLTFEASGGLLHGALVMNDDESGSYWSIMQGEAIAGARAGASLKELPHGEKTTWSDWLTRHPETEVLSLGGVEDLPGQSPYANYFASERGFRGLSASDDRLPTKASIFAFHLDGRAVAVPHTALAGGAAFSLGQESEPRWIFLHRPAGASMFRSTSAWISAAGFERRQGRWRERGSGATFDPARGRWESSAETSPAALPGFDTFWYVWSLTNPATELLEPPQSHRGG
jgi:hypothetical protein